MRIFRLIALMAGMGLILACNFPMFSPTAQPSSPTPTSAGVTPLDTPTPLTPTLTAVPTISPTPTIVPTPNVPQVSPITAAVNCRSGPDVSYPAASSIAVGQVAQITGRNNDSSWWYVRDPYNTSSFCWVSAAVVTTAGNLAGLPVVAPPASIVTKVTVNADVASPVVCGGPNVIMFSGQVTTNGATKVQVQWEITGDKDNTTPSQAMNFKGAGSKSAPDPGAYSADCGHYTITLHVTSPNDISASQKFSVEP